MSNTNTCPCELVAPCSPQCTCANPVLSGGCQRCCKYGSREQQEAAARRIAEADRVMLERAMKIVGNCVEYYDHYTAGDAADSPDELRVKRIRREMIKSLHRDIVRAIRAELAIVGGAIKAVERCAIALCPLCGRQRDDARSCQCAFHVADPSSDKPTYESREQIVERWAEAIRRVQWWEDDEPITWEELAAKEPAEAEQYRRVARVAIAELDKQPALFGPIGGPLTELTRDIEMAGATLTITKTSKKEH